MTQILREQIVCRCCVQQEHVSDILQEFMTLEDLGVKLTALEDRAPYELKPYRQSAMYEERVGEFPHPEPPPVVMA